MSGMNQSVQTAKSGAEVLIVAGLATASLVNPEREASQWLELQHARLKSTGPDEPVVTIGVGSGFHLRALQVEMKERGLKGAIYALDTCRESIAFASQRIAGVTFILADISQTADAFFSHHNVGAWLTQTSTLLKHRPTISRVGVSLKTIETWVLGRTPEAFSAQLKLRPQIAASLNPQRASKVAECPLVSIRDLAKMWDISSELKTDRRLFRVLEELVR